ncbi:DEAD/DEAH box helicase family protein [Heyndrickxia faecalis]|uniref:DEAD/DEAH box helicase family protein n=1 Tax=Heyndrickxia faecalis TaxID=2824910 RepID=A0AAU7WHY2_9BACI
MKSNFSFFKGKWDVLANLGETAEKNVYQDPHTTIMKLRLFAETLTKFVLAAENIKEAYGTSQVDRIHTLRREGLIEPELMDIFETLRRKGNQAMHEALKFTTEEAKALLRLAFRLSIWFMEVYGEWDFQAPEYIEPKEQKKVDTEQLQQEYEEKLKKLEDELESIRAKASKENAEEKTERKKRAVTFMRRHELTEAETRAIIDEKLRAVGWEADTTLLNHYTHGTVPEKNRNMAIAEWKVGSGSADYALFIGLKLVGLIEAKAKKRTIPSALESQTKAYARQVRQIENEEILQTRNEYKVPFLYATNGRPFLRQLQEESGIWFWDSRKPLEHARPLEGCHSPDDLLMLLGQDDEDANQRLEEESISIFGLRPYQEKAVLAAEEALKAGQRRMLIAMATGTGKTRTAIALMYRLIKSKKCRRILFLVDRNSLGKQTEDALKDTKIEGYSFSDIYDVKSIGDISPEVATKVHIATVQGMVRRLFYSNEEKIPSVGQYDFIIVDEAHRGYTSDREMSEEELLFRDQNDYVSQYRRVLDYFDAACLGLTATPALHTTQIFGMPISEEALKKSSAKLFPKDSVAIAMYGATIGKLGILGIDAATNQACAVGVPHFLMDKDFMFYYFFYQRKTLIDLGKGGAQPNISQTIIKDFPHLLPPLKEQKRIVNKIKQLLSKIDEAKRLIEEAKETFELRRAAILDKAFQGELTRKWREQHPEIESAEVLYNKIIRFTKPKNVSSNVEQKLNIPDTWKMVRLGEVVQVNPPKKKLEEISDQQICTFVPMPAVSDKTGKIESPEEKEYAKVKKGYTFFLENDVLFAKITPCMENGKSAIAKNLKNGFGFGSTEFHVLRTNEYINERYLHYLVRSKKFRLEAKGEMTGAVGQQRVPKEFLVNYPFPLPPKEEQNAIVDILDEIFTRDDIAYRIIETKYELETLKQSILSKAFRGELGTNDPDEESAIELLKEVLQEQVK